MAAVAENNGGGTGEQRRRRENDRDNNGGNGARHCCCHVFAIALATFGVDNCDPTFWLRGVKAPGKLNTPSPESAHSLSEMLTRSPPELCQL